MSINNYLTTIVKKKKIVGRGIGSGRGKTCGRGGKGQTARTGGGPKPGFEGGQTKVYLRFPKRGGRRGGKFKKSSQTTYRIINLENLEKDEKIVNGQILDFFPDKQPVKILGEGELTKTLTIKAVGFSQSAQEKVTKAGGKLLTTASLYFEKIMNILRNAEFSQQKRKDGTWE